ncbi:hypothetical protein ACSS7Z_09895 [Microbacterium sp. A82]|uniref:hypothetical protein n=1 Tax=Microbacterium sp. A82 TaxID=3450452 RepID=UPI003F317186
MSIQADIQTIQNNGATLTKRHEEIEERWNAYVATERVPASVRLAEAVVSGEGDIALLEELAIAETQYPASIRGAALIRARQVIDIKIAAEVKISGRDAYEKFQAEFNAAAIKFDEAASIQSPAADGAILVGASQKIQKAWMDGNALTLELNRLFGALQAAARLTGIHVTPQSAQMGLVIDRNGAHRRKVWTAWTDEHRWVAILATGATIQAPNLDDYQPFREPAPIVGSGGSPAHFDPEDYEDSDDPRHIAAVAASKRTDTFAPYAMAMQELAN